MTETFYRDNLTRKEFFVLRILNREAPEIVTRTLFHEEVFQDLPADSNIVDVYINKLRKKKFQIRTHRGIGYSLEKAVW